MQSIGFNRIAAAEAYCAMIDPTKLLAIYSTMRLCDAECQELLLSRNKRPSACNGKGATPEASDAPIIQLVH